MNLSHLLSLYKSLFIFEMLLLRDNILLYLFLQREFLDYVWLWYFRFDLALFWSSLLLASFRGSIRVIIWFVFGTVSRKLIVLSIGVRLVLKLLFIHFLEHVGNDLAIKVIRTVKLINLLVLPIKDADEHIYFAKGWKLNAFLKKSIFPLCHRWPSVHFIWYWA